VAAAAAEIADGEVDPALKNPDIGWHGKAGEPEVGKIPIGL
jgi:hypothetical protein